MESVKDVIEQAPVADAPAKIVVNGETATVEPAAAPKFIKAMNTSASLMTLSNGQHFPPHHTALLTPEEFERFSNHKLVVEQPTHALLTVQVDGRSL